MYVALLSFFFPLEICIEKSLSLFASRFTFYQALTLIFLFLFFVKIDPLAYITAKAHGLTDESEAILAAAGMTEEQISLPSMGKPADVPTVVVPTYKAKWPVKTSSSSSFVKALLGEEDDEGEGEGEGEGEEGMDDEGDGEIVDVEDGEDEEEEDLLR